MRVIAIASQKGGSGKTTLAGHLAVQAEKAGAGTVALIDADPQGSLADWWNEREEPTPVFVHTSQQRLEQDIEDVRELGVDLLIIDTPPAITATISDVIRVSDLVLIPTRPSPHDLRSVGRTVELVEALSKPLIFVVNGATPRARITSEAAIALSQHGTLAPSIIHQRVDFAASMIDGRTVMELDPRSRSAKEIAKLWDYLKNRMERNMRPTTIGTGGTPMSAAGPTDMDRVHRQDTN
jgi:chromosome partitioning protein